MKTFNPDVFLFAAATVGLAMCAAGARADQVMPAAPTRTVQYADLNLDTAAGAKALYQRIHVAAEQVCGDVHSRQLDVAAAAQACVDQAVVAGVRAVNRVQLTRMANTHGYQVQYPVALAAR